MSRKAKPSTADDGYIEPSARGEWPVAKPESEALPDLPTENVKQFIGRMKNDYDLTNI